MEWDEARAAIVENRNLFDLTRLGACPHFIIIPSIEEYRHCLLLPFSTLNRHAFTHTYTSAFELFISDEYLLYQRNQHIEIGELSLREHIHTHTRMYTRTIEIAARNWDQILHTYTHRCEYARAHIRIDGKRESIPRVAATAPASAPASETQIKIITKITMTVTEKWLQAHFATLWPVAHTRSSLYVLLLSLRVYVRVCVRA